MALEKIAFIAADMPQAADALGELVGEYGNCAPEEADVIVAIGGDGFMLETLHRHIDHDIPVYGINVGSVGFLMNSYEKDGLKERLASAAPVTLHPLRMVAATNGTTEIALAINEVSLLRQTGQAAKIGIKVYGVTRIAELV